jgi:protein SCO1/2
MNKTQRVVALAVLVLMVTIVAGCGDRGADAPKESKEYAIKGTVTAIDGEKKNVTLDHEDIPGLMEAMEMEFAVSEPKVLEGISVGDAVGGRLQKSDELVITRLEKQ